MAPDLLALPRAEQERAKVRLRARLWAHGGTFVLCSVALFATEPAVYVTAVLALCTEAAAWFLRFQAGALHDQAEQGRRRATLIGELGSDPDSLSTSGLLADFSDAARVAAPKWSDPSYYASAQSPGPERLRESLQESAFWSSRLYRAAGQKVLMRTALLSALVVIGLLLAVGLDAASAGEAAARAATVALATLITADELGMALAYFGAGRTSDQVVTRFDMVDPADLGQMLAVYGDYATATALAPPIPDKLYRKRHDATDAAWRSRSHTPPTTEPTSHEDQG